MLGCCKRVDTIFRSKLGCRIRGDIQEYMDAACGGNVIIKEYIKGRIGGRGQHIIIQKYIVGSLQG